MAHNVEPMDVDSEFDNKENSYHHSNVLPCTEKGYEELDVSELNMKLRYSVTPASSPMSKSYTANCTENRIFESGDGTVNVIKNDNANLTRSLNSNLKNDNIVKSLKLLPLQMISTEQFIDSNKNASVLRPLDTVVTSNDANVTVTVSKPNDIDENLSLPSSSSSTVHTPEATTPTKEILKTDGGSPIMRGLKSVLNMFRSSQSPIPPADGEDTPKQEVLSPAEMAIKPAGSTVVMASTPISVHRKKETSPSKRNSPYKESIVFNDDLEKELQWKDETTILFSQERIPIHKLLFQQPAERRNTENIVNEVPQKPNKTLNSTLEYMDISFNDSALGDQTLQPDRNKIDGIACESDSEFVDCETTFTKNESCVIDDKVVEEINKIENLTKNGSSSKLNPIILNTTQDILDATLSITSEDFAPKVLDSVQKLSSSIVMPNTIDLDNYIHKIQEPEKINESMKQCLGNEEENIDTIQETHTDQTHTENKDQALEIVNETVTIGSENLNVSKSSENMSIDIKTVEDQHQIMISENVNVTQLSDNIHDKTKILKDKISDPNFENIDITHTVDYSLIECKLLEHRDAINPILNMSVEYKEISHLCNLEHKEILLVNNIDTVLTLPEIEALNSAEKNNTTDDYNRLNDNKVEDVNVMEKNNLIIEHEFPLEHYELNQTKETTNRSCIDNIISTAESKNDLVETNSNNILRDNNISTENKSFVELPANIPLPDEDDIEKETTVTVNTAQPSNGTFCSPTPDLVDVVKLKTDNNNDKNTTSTVDHEDIMLSEALQINNPFTEAINYYQTESQLSESKKECHDDTSNFENENLFLCNTPQVLPLQDKILQCTDNTEHIGLAPISSQILNETMSIMEPLNNKIEHNDIQKAEILDIPLPMDIKESVCDLQVLPDIINQTINSPCHEIAKSVEKNNEIIEQHFESNIEDTDQNVKKNLSSAQCNVESTGTEIKPTVTDSEPQDIELKDVAGTDVSTPKNEDEDIPVATKIETAVNKVIVNMSIDEKIENPTNIINTEQEAEIVTPNQTNNIQFKKSAEAINIAANENITETNTKVIDEEVVVSKNNSPFVCIMAETEVKNETDDILNSFTTKTRIVSTPPPSPPITSKGYNFNFDEMDNPFDTNTKIRMSPTPDSPNKYVESKLIEQKIEKPTVTNSNKKDINRRKSQPERKRPPATKKKFNSTFNNTTADTRVEEKPISENKDIQSTTVFDKEDKEVQDIIKKANENIEIKFQAALKAENESKSADSEEPVDEVPVVAASSTDSINEVKTSSSEQSTYFSAGTSSSESFKSRNVFNIPEIDDMNFNPFATKSKMRQSPPLVQDEDNPFVTRTKIITSPIGEKSLSPNIHENYTKTTNFNETNIPLEDKMETEPMEKDTSNNTCDMTSSFKTERDATIKEINTEDEDTIDGPFLDLEDLENDDNNIIHNADNDMMHFNELPSQAKEENLEADEMFIDAEAFEFLLNQNKSNTVVDSGKESLFLKFDPLFAKRTSSDSLLAALTQLQKRQSTPVKLMKPPQKEAMAPIAGTSNMNITHNIDLNTSEQLNDDLNVTVSKPMMVVPPAVNPVTPRNKSITPTRSNRRSITFTSPAMAVIDRLLSLSGNNSPVHDNTYIHVSREQNEADIALSQLRELLAEKEIHVYNLRSESKELKDRLDTMESTVRSLETESQDRLKKINDLNDQLAEKTKINRSMAAVVEEYERTIASLISETEQDKKRHAEERAKLINERDEQTAHLASMEVSFSDLHSKYEKSKQVILSCKANEDAYKKTIKDFEVNLSKMQNNYELLKQHATSKLNHANQELEKMNKAHEAEVLKLNAMIKRKELHITSLEETLTQKTKANEELTAICDELINKVG